MLAVNQLFSEHESDDELADISSFDCWLELTADGLQHTTEGITYLPWMHIIAVDTVAAQ